MENKTAKFALALSVLLVVLLSGCTGPSGGPTKGLWVWGWEGLVGIVIVTVVLMLALGYMASVLFGNEQLRVWVKREVGQAAYSILIIVAAVALVGVMDDWMQFGIIYGGTSQWQTYIQTGPCCNPATTSCLGGPNYHMMQPCHILVAKDYLQMLYETARLNSITYMSNNMMIGLLGNLQVSVNLNVEESRPVLTIAPFAGLSAGAEYFMILFDLSAKAMMMLRVQQVMLDFLNYPVFGILLSMGLVLRIFYFTRKLGGLLVAIALVSYVVFPMYYAISDAVLFSFLGGQTTTWKPFGGTYDNVNAPNMFNDPLNPGNNQGTIDPNPNYGSVFTSQNQLNMDVCSTADPSNGNVQAQGDLNEFDLMRSNFVNGWDQVEGNKWYEQVGDWVTMSTGSGGFSPHGPIGTLATLIILTLVTPFLAFMTILAAVKVFSPMIGGDVEISVLSRLI
ncbi:MAG: hypothetical protein NTV88_00250 [Candidatus Micrarchaeota archaeon]|nr:hypothetical protein [Candidatus Micrarchaeota archaeon]